MNQPNFLIVDGSSLLVRAYFGSAYGGAILRSSQGVYINAVMGFTNMLLRLIDQMKPSHLFIAWDVSRDTFRKELYPSYKGTRGELPLELHPQFQTTRDLMDCLGIVQYSHERFEADDIIGSLAQLAKEEHHVLILTGDHDALQLVDDQVTVAIMKKGITEMKYYTPETLASEWGMTPEQIIDLKGLMGDTSDNIPGVQGIGEKTAKKLLAEYGTLENLIENSSSLKGKLKEKIETNHEIARLSKLLATIETKVPIPHKPEDCKLNLQFDSGSIKLAELELHRILNQLKKIVLAG